MKNIIAKYTTINELAIQNHQEVRKETSVAKAVSNIIEENKNRLIAMHVFCEETDIDISFMEV